MGVQVGSEQTQELPGNSSRRKSRWRSDATDRRYTERLRTENSETTNTLWIRHNSLDTLDRVSYVRAYLRTRLRIFVAGVIMASLLAVQPAMMQDRNCFELYGYDILLSDDLRPWLLEVNASPALTGTDNEDHRLKFDLIDDVLNVLDFEVKRRSKSLVSREIRRSVSSKREIAWQE